MELVVAIISGIVAIASVCFSIYTYRSTVIHDRKKATLEAYNRLQAEVFDSLNSYTPTEISDICKNVKSTEYKTVSGYLARIEHFCVGITERIYDREVFYKLAHGYFDGHILYPRIKPILISKKNSKEYYKNLYSVLEWMEHTSKLNL